MLAHPILENEKMLEVLDSNTKDNPSAQEIRNLRRQAYVYAQQIAAIIDIIN